MEGLWEPLLLWCSESIASFIVLLGSLSGHHCGKSVASFRLVYCDKEEALLPDLSSRLLRHHYASYEWRARRTRPRPPLLFLSTVALISVHGSGRLHVQVHRVMGRVEL